MTIEKAITMTMTVPMKNENHAPLPADAAIWAGPNAMTALGAILATLCAPTSNGVTLRRARPPL